jgi:hypothetical protein
LTIERLHQYATCIENTGGSNGIWGFIDGTQKEICRPNEAQRQFYSGYKKAHTIKFQGIITPDGILSHLAGPFEGKLGDWAAWVDSGVEKILRELHEGLSEDERLYLYGDPAYTVSFAIMGPYKARVGHPLTESKKAINAHMSSLRISVEHGFGKIMNLFSFNGYRRGLRIGLSPVGSYYMMAVLLANIHTCLQGSQTAEKFGIDPPSLDDYLRL